VSSNRCPVTDSQSSCFCWETELAAGDLLLTDAQQDVTSLDGAFFCVGRSFNWPNEISILRLHFIWRLTGALSGGRGGGISLTWLRSKRNQLSIAVLKTALIRSAKKTWTRYVYENLFSWLWPLREMPDQGTTLILWSPVFAWSGFKRWKTWCRLN